MACWRAEISMSLVSRHPSFPVGSELKLGLNLISLTLVQKRLLLLQISLLLLFNKIRQQRQTLQWRQLTIFGLLKQQQPHKIPLRQTKHLYNNKIQLKTKLLFNPHKTQQLLQLLFSHNQLHLCNRIYLRTLLRHHRTLLRHHRTLLRHQVLCL